MSCRRFDLAVDTSPTVRNETPCCASHGLLQVARQKIIGATYAEATSDPSLATSLHPPRPTELCCHPVRRR